MVNQDFWWERLPSSSLSQSVRRSSSGFITWERRCWGGRWWATTFASLTPRRVRLRRLSAARVSLGSLCLLPPPTSRPIRSAPFPRCCRSWTAASSWPRRVEAFTLSVCVRDGFSGGDRTRSPTRRARWREAWNRHWSSTNSSSNKVILKQGAESM